jgi:hypothetical protein
MEGMVAGSQNILLINWFFLVNLTMIFNCLGYVMFSVMVKQNGIWNKIYSGDKPHLKSILMMKTEQAPEIFALDLRVIRLIHWEVFSAFAV